MNRATKDESGGSHPLRETPRTMQPRPMRIGYSQLHVETPPAIAPRPEMAQVSVKASIRARTHEMKSRLQHHHQHPCALLLTAPGSRNKRPQVQRECQIKRQRWNHLSCRQMVQKKPDGKLPHEEAGLAMLTFRFHTNRHDPTSGNRMVKIE